MSNPKSAAIYCRLARMDDRCAEAQQMRVMEFAKENGYTDITVYMDNGVHGLTLNRPAFKQMEAAINRGEIGTVIMLSIDRLGRNVVEVLRWMEGMWRHGIEFRAVHGLPDSINMSLLLSPRRGNMVLGAGNTAQNKTKGETKCGTADA